MDAAGVGYEAPEPSAPSLSERLRAAGLAERPALTLGRRLATRIILIEDALGPQTLGSLADVLPSITAVRTIGPGTEAEIRTALEAQLGPPTAAEASPTGTNSPARGAYVPATVPDDARRDMRAFVSFILSVLDPAKRETVVGRIGEGRTLDAMGRAAGGVTREAIRQRQNAVIDDLRLRYGETARALVAPFRQRLEARGGVAYLPDLAVDLGAPLDASSLRIALAIAGGRRVRVWGDEILLGRRGSFAETAEQIVRVLRATGHMAISLGRATEEVRVRLGLHLSEEGLACLLARAARWTPAAEDALRLGPWLGVAARATDLLREAGRPLHIRELGALLAAESAGRSAAPGGAVTGGSPFERAMQTKLRHAIVRGAPILQVGRGEYAHEDALPFRVDDLAAAVDWAVAVLVATGRTMNTVTLLREAQSRGLVPPGVTAYALKEALLRHPDVVSQRKLLVSHREAGRTLREVLERVLLSAERPLHSDEVYEAVAAHGECSRAASYELLRKTALRVGDGEYVHPERLGLSAPERAEVVEEAIGLLPADGSAIPAERVLRGLTSRAPHGIVDHHDRHRALWGLLNRDGRCECTGGWLVARRGRASRVPRSEELAAGVLRELVAASIREVVVALVRSRDYRGSFTTMRDALQAAARAGRLQHRLGSLFALPDTDDEALTTAIARQDRTLNRALGAKALRKHPARDLALLARCLERRGRVEDAARVLARLREVERA